MATRYADILPDVMPVDVTQNVYEPIYPLVGDPQLGTGSYSLPIMQQNPTTGSVGVDRNFMRTDVRPALGILGDSSGLPGYGAADLFPFTAPFLAAGDYVARNMNREYVGRPGAQILDLAGVAIPGALDAALIPAARRGAGALYDRAIGDRLPMSADELSALQNRMDTAVDVTPAPPAQIAAPEAAAPRQMEPPPLLAADEAPFPNSGTFQTTDNGNLIGYKVMAVEDGKLVSGANTRLSFENAVGGNISMPGQGVFFSNNPEYVKSYYAGLADNEVLLKLEVDPKNIKSGNINDVEPEIGASTAKIVGIEPIEPQPLVMYDQAPVGGNPVGNIADPIAQKPVSGAMVSDPPTGPYANEIPVTYQGKPLETLNPDEFADLGRSYGVDNLGPLSPAVRYQYSDGASFEIPGGIDGEFTYYDLLKIRSDAIDPSRIPAELHTQIQRKLVDTMTPKVITDEHVFNAMLFGITSPNQPLFANQLAASRLRVRDRDDIERLASFFKYPVNAKLAKEQKLEIDREMARTFGVQAGKDGGLGIKGSADYSNIARLAKLYLDCPEFFRIGPAESWPLFVDRLSSQVQGLGTKTAAFSAVWQKPNVAGVSAIDRHMASIFFDKFYRTKKAKAEAERVLSDRWGAAIDQRRQIDKQYKGRTDSDEYKRATQYLPSGSAKKVRGKAAILREAGGEGFFTDHMLAQLKPRSSKLMTPNPNVGRSAMASLISGTEFNPSPVMINPNISKEYAGINWVAQPDQIFMASPLYKRAIELNVEEAEKTGLSVFAEQWRKWDRQRRSLEPHENMFPGLEKMPKISHEQMRSVLAKFKQQGVTDQQKVEFADPETDVLTQRLKPNRPLEGDPAGLAYFDQGPGILQSADPWVDDAGTPVYPMYYNFRELPDSYAKDKVAQWLGAREGGFLDDAEQEAARRADENDLLRGDRVARGGTPSLQSRVDERLQSVRGSLGAWSLAFDDAGQLKKELSRQDLLEMAEVLVDVLHVGGRKGLDTATRGFQYSNPSFNDPTVVTDAAVQKIPNLLQYNPDSDDFAKIAPGYRQIGINVDNVLAAQDKARTDPRYQSLLPIEFGLPDGKPEDLFMYVLTHEMGHAMHESVPRLQEQLRNFPSSEIDPAISLSRVLTNLLSRNSAEEGAVLSRYDAVNLGATMQEEAIKISKKRRPTAWANSERGDPNFGIRTSEAERFHNYLHMPQELLADVAATMLENPASIRKTEIYEFLKNLFGKGVYKDVIKFGAFGGLTLPQILQMSEQNETEG